MPSAPASRSFRPDEPFRRVGGHVAADLVDTVDWAAAGPDRHRLADYGRVVEWAEAAGTIDDATARRLSAAAGGRPRRARRTSRPAGSATCSVA